MAARPSLTASDDHILMVTLTTTFALIDQFSNSITPSSSKLSGLAREHPPSSTPSPLVLLSASAASLKAQSTKLSLLTLTPPFTPSAVSTVLSALNSSVLPSLLTAALLITNEEYKCIASFSAEVCSLVKATLRDLNTLVSCVDTRTKHGNPRGQPDEQQKSSVTEAVGRLWESCSDLVALADGGIGAFVIKKAEMWLGLIKDAVEELREWDPEEDGVDGLFGEDAQQDDDAEEETEECLAAAEKAKASAMRVLTRVPQSLHVVVKQRLQKWDWRSMDSNDSSNAKESDVGGSLPSKHVDSLHWEQGTTVDHVLRSMQYVSETVDEMAEALYMGEINRSSKLVSDVWKATVEIVALVKSPVDGHAGHGKGCPVVAVHSETSEDKYIQRAYDWIKLVEPISPSSHAVINGSTQGSTDG